MGRARTLEHIADLRRRPGTQRPVERVVPASALGELGTTTAVVPPESDVELDAVAEATGVDIVLTGRATFRWEGECRRCLRPVSGSTGVEVREVFEPHPTEGETWPVEGDAIDLGPMLREDVLLALPLVPLCSDDCAGPDPERFPATPEIEASAVPREGAGGSDGEPHEGEPGRDPRWAALDALRFEDDA